MEIMKLGMDKDMREAGTKVCCFLLMKPMISFGLREDIYVS